MASILLAILAIACGYVSYRAQFAFVHQIKKEWLASTFEALGLDAGSVIFAFLGLAQAREGKPARLDRILNVACVGLSLFMNISSSGEQSFSAVAVFAIPAALYAAASDRLVSVVRERVIEAHSASQAPEKVTTLHEMSQAERVRTAVRDMGGVEMVTTPAVTKWLTNHGTAASISSINNTLSLMRKN